MHNFTMQNRNAVGHCPLSKEVVQRIHDSFNANPRLALRSAELDIEIYRSSIQLVLRKILHGFPYKLQITQYLEKNDILCRIQFANYCL